MSTDGQSALIWTVIGVIIPVIHFLPSFLAFSKNHPSRALILILNILIGWTIIGWVILMVWVTKKE